MGERATSWRTSFSLDLTWSAVHLAVHSPECLPPDPRQPGRSVFRSAGDGEIAVVMITQITKVYEAPDGRLRNRRRLSGCFSAGVFKPPGDFPKRKLVGFTWRTQQTNRKIELPTVSPQCAWDHAAMLVELVKLVSINLRRTSRIV